MVEEEVVSSELVWGAIKQDFPAETVQACLALLRRTHPQLAREVSHSQREYIPTSIHHGMVVVVLFAGRYSTTYFQTKRCNDDSLTQLI